MGRCHPAGHRRQADRARLRGRRRHRGGHLSPGAERRPRWVPDEAAASVRDAAFGRAPGSITPVGPHAGYRWHAAVALGGQGHYAAAWTALSRLIVAPGVPAAVAAHAAVTRASHLRQMGAHGAARTFDALALRRLGGLSPDAMRGTGLDPDGPDPDGTGPAAARVDALIGMAADALGLGDPGGARRLLDVVHDGVAVHPSWRPRARWGWVSAELALLEGRPDAAVEPAAAALAAVLAVAPPSRSLRHEVKSRLVWTVARAAAGVSAPADALAELDALVDSCARHGLLPLQWAGSLAAADLAALAAERGNDAPGRRVGAAVADRTNDAAHRRHAAMVALSVLYCRADPIGKRWMGESLSMPAQVTVM